MCRSGGQATGLMDEPMRWNEAGKQTKRTANRMASCFEPTRRATRRGEKRGGKQSDDEMGEVSSYPVSHVMDCVAVSSGIRYEMMTGRGRDDGRDGKQ